jgi:hypothetical protein
MKKIILLLVIVIVLFVGQNVLADTATLFVEPASVTKNVGETFNANVQVNPAGNKVCVVKGTLTFDNLTCQSVLIASGLPATITPTCESPNFSVGIPGCATSAKNILQVSVKGTKEGQGSLSFANVKIAGEGAYITFSQQPGSYTIKTVPVPVVETAVPEIVIAPAPVVSVKPKATVSEEKITASPSTDSGQATEQPAPAIVMKEVATASTGSVMSKVLKSPMTWIVLLVIALSIAGNWAYDKFIKKNKKVG